MGDNNLICLSNIEANAKKKLTQHAWNYFSCGRDDEQTIFENCKAFDRLRIKPHYLHGIVKARTACFIQGQTVNIPICIAPSALHKMAHSVAENDAAIAAESNGTCMAVSVINTITDDKLVETAPNALFWMQLPIFKDRNITVGLIRPTEMAGFKAIALTIDQVFFTREDALEALKHDVQGIIVSNHGERQLDGVLSTIEALPEIVEAVNGKIEVYLDGGIRRGTDVFKALALGAKAVFVGRPVLYELSYNGTNGVKKMFQILQDEFEQTMLLAGCASLADITSDMVVHKSYYWKLPNNKL